MIAANRHFIQQLRLFSGWQGHLPMAGGRPHLSFLPTR
jgi:hypothetical protein